MAKLILDFENNEYYIGSRSQDVDYSGIQGVSNVKDALDYIIGQIGEGGGSTPLSNHLNILILGNSYSCDSFGYLPFILKAYGITVTVGIYVRPGGTLNLLYSEYATAQGAFFFIDTRTDLYWTQPTSPGPKGLVQYAHNNNFHWDMIVMQQASSDAVTGTTFSHAEDIVKLINADMDGSYVLGWNINHTRKKNIDGNVDESLDNPSAVLANCADVCESLPVDIVFPYGTAIFNARQNQTLAALGGGGNLWSYDMVHLNEGFPCYLANLATAEALFKKFYPQFSVLGDRNYATSDWVADNHISVTIDRVGSPTNADFSATNCYLAQKAAIMAVRNPFEITTI